MQNRPNIVVASGLLVVATCVGQQACATDFAHKPPSSMQRTLTELAHQARPGTLGIEVKDLESGRTWRVNAGRAFPLMSVFKAPLGATVLSKVDRGTISLSQPVIIRRSELMRSGLSQIAEKFRGEEETFTVRQLLRKL